MLNDAQGKHGHMLLRPWEMLSFIQAPSRIIVYPSDGGLMEGTSVAGELNQPPPSQPNQKAFLVFKTWYVDCQGDFQLAKVCFIKLSYILSVRDQ